MVEAQCDWGVGMDVRFYVMVGYLFICFVHDRERHNVQ